MKPCPNPALSSGQPLFTILAPLARSWKIWSDHLDDLAASYAARPGFQTCLTEIRWIEINKDRLAREAIVKLCNERALRRHLEVAARKLRHQNGYTYVIEIENARVRPRSQSPSEKKLNDTSML